MIMETKHFKVMCGRLCDMSIDPFSFSFFNDILEEKAMRFKSIVP
jgi:hypothetical protein